MRMWTKLRPGVREFLEAARGLFDLHIYTMGDREYAGEMARLLDPGRRLFHGGVISAVGGWVGGCWGTGKGGGAGRGAWNVPG